VSGVPEGYWTASWRILEALALDLWSLIDLIL